MRTTTAQDTVILQCVGIGVVTTLGGIGRGEGLNAKGLIGTALLAAALSGVAAVDGETAVGLGTIALVGSTLATVAGKNVADVSFKQLGKIGDKIPAKGESATERYASLMRSVESAIGNQVAETATDVAAGATNITAKGGFAKPLGASYPAPGPHASARNAFGGDAVDLMVPKGTPVYAVQAGRIGTQFGLLDSNPGSVLAGKRLHLLTGDGNDWYYAHLDRFAPDIRPGVVVRAGQLLGYSGVANNAAHLHLEDKYQTVRRRI